MESDTNKTIGYLNKFDAILDAADFLQEHRKVQIKKKSRVVSEELFNQFYFTDGPDYKNLYACSVCHSKIHQIRQKTRLKKRLIEPEMGTCGCYNDHKEHKDVSCVYPYLIIGGEIVRRNSTEFDCNEQCHDCGVVNKEGNYHHWGCDTELCPKCGGQMLSCYCSEQVVLLRKTEEEMKEYFEDLQKKIAAEEQRKNELQDRKSQNNLESETILKRTIRMENERDIFQEFE